MKYSTMPLIGLFIGLAVLALPAVGQGVWTSEAPMPTALYGQSTGVINGKLYSASGCCSAFTSPFPRFTTLQVYDPATNTWSTAAPIPTGVVDGPSGVINGKLYVAGGAADQAHGNNIAALQVYDQSADTWTTKAPLLAASNGGSAGVIDGKLYVASGTDPSNTAVLNTLVVYDPIADSWNSLAPIPSPHELAASAVINGLLYVVGGVSGTGVVNTVQAYDPSTDAWRTLAPMPTARYALAAGVIDGILYAVGGYDNTNVLATVEAYDPVSNTWRTATSMPTSSCGPGAAAINGILYVAGGGCITGLLNNLQAFAPTTAQIQQPINPDGSSVFNASRGVVPVKFTLIAGGAASCTLPPANIALTRTAGNAIGSIDESAYTMAADSGSTFRISDCQYIYNLASKALGPGTYRVDIILGGGVVGSGVFGLK